MTVSRVATWIGTGLVAAFVLIATVGQLHASPTALVGAGLDPPSWDHPFGTDPLGRDLLARTAAGAWTSLVISLGSIGLATVVAAPLGLLAAWNQNRPIDMVVMRMTETFQVVPQFVLVIILLGLSGQGDVEVLGLTVSTRTRIIGAIALGFIPFVTRVVRAAAARELSEDYIHGLRLLGVRRREILLNEVTPNIAPAVGAQLLLALAIAVFAEGGLSFVGLGLPVPAPTLGNLIADAGGQLLDQVWWYTMIPGGVLVAGITGLNLLAEAASDRNLGVTIGQAQIPAEPLDPAPSGGRPGTEDQQS